MAEVKRIDNDEIAYNAMRNEPIFLDNFNPKDFYEKRVLEFFDSIFSQNPSEAFRRGEGLLLQGYRNGMKNARECAHLCKDAIKLAQGYDFLRKATSKVRNKLKFWRAFS